MSIKTRIVDFRDQRGTTTFGCPVCGNLATGWDMRERIVYHAEATNGMGRMAKAPCDLKIGL